MSYLKTAPKRYVLELTGALTLMAAIVWLRQVAIRATADPALILAARLLPVVPVLIIALAVHRLYRSRDEFQQQAMLKSAAAGGLLGMLIMMAYAPLNALGLPPFSRQVGLIILSVSYVLCGAGFAFVNLRAVHGTRQALIRLAPMLVLLLPVAWWAASRFLPLPALSFAWAILLTGAVAILYGFYTAFIRSWDA
jgi:hypothetical protein